MDQAQILFPEPAFTPAASRVVPFQPREPRRARERRDSRLSGDGLAERLRSDVERQIAHRRRMLAHLQTQAPAAARRE